MPLTVYSDKISSYEEVLEKDEWVYVYYKNI